MSGSKLRGIANYMMWKNKVVIITGSSIGIGRRLAFEIGKRGGKVVINARNKSRLDKTYADMKSQGLDVSACPGDISKYEDCVKIIAHSIKIYDKLDVLINNAGIAAKATLEEIKPVVFKQVMDVNFLGSVFMTQAALPYIRKTEGSILFIGSLAGIHGIGNYSAYSSSKMALTALVESLRIEMHQTGIHIGLAYVGFAENDPEKTFLNKDGLLMPQFARNTIKQVPVKKVALRLMRMIERRQSKSAFTLLGKLNAILNRISPFLVHRILLNAYKKDQN